MSSSKDPKNTPEAEEKKKNDPLGDDFLSSSLDDIFNDLEGGLGSGKGGLSASTGNSSQKDASTPVDLGAETQKAPTPKLSKTASQTSLPSVPKTPAPTKKTTKRTTSSILPAIPKTPAPPTLVKKEASTPAAPVVKTTAPEKKEPAKVTTPAVKESTKPATPATKEPAKVTASEKKEPAKPAAPAKAETKKEPTLSVAAASETAPTIPDVPALTVPVVNVELPEENKPSKVEAKPPKAEASEPPKVMGKEDKKEKTFDAVAPTVEYSPDERLIEKMATLPPEPKDKVESPKTAKAPEKKVDSSKAPEKKVEPPKAPEKKVESPKTAKA
ncbi:MAG TPA: hypothetical protein DCE42_24685, partial [Myxococcales bacterium]|nr:hypothetical protein [Myxococcales bacterium]